VWVIIIDCCWVLGTEEEAWGLRRRPRFPSRTSGTDRCHCTGTQV